MSGLRPPVPGSADAQPSAGGAGSDGVGDRAEHRRDDGGLALHDGGCPHQAEASVSINLALTDYYDHQTEMDAEIERLIREDEALRAQAGVSKAEQRLRQRGSLP